MPMCVCVCVCVSCYVCVCVCVCRSVCVQIALLSSCRPTVCICQSFRAYWIQASSQVGDWIMEFVKFQSLVPGSVWLRVGRPLQGFCRTRGFLHDGRRRLWQANCHSYCTLTAYWWACICVCVCLCVCGYTAPGFFRISSYCPLRITTLHASHASREWVRVFEKLMLQDRAAHVFFFLSIIGFYWIQFSQNRRSKLIKITIFVYFLCWVF